MTFCLDTDQAIEYLKGNTAVTSKIESSEEEICITPITVLELFYGAYRSAQVSRRVGEVRLFVNAFEVLPFNQLVYEQFGLLKAELAERGELLDNFDLVIASFCRAHNHILVTSNKKHFERIKGLKIENWR